MRRTPLAIAVLLASSLAAATLPLLTSSYLEPAD